MIRGLYILIVTILSVTFSGCQLHDTDNITVNDNNITLLIDRPSSGIVSTNGWNWPNLENALDDLYTQFKYHNPYITKYDSYNIKVRLRTKERDKYGKESYNYEDSYHLVTVSGDEIEKYESAKYMDRSLGLTSKIKDVVRQTTTVYYLNYN